MGGDVCGVGCKGGGGQDAGLRTPAEAGWGWGAGKPEEKRIECSRVRCWG